MKKYLSAIKMLLIFLLALNQTAYAQFISRSVICSMGATQVGVDGNTIQATFGQCPGCETYVGTNGQILNQGFQQPSSAANCAGFADFEFDEEMSNCGTNYNFFYVGVADIGQATFLWDFGPDAFPQTSSESSPMGVSFSSPGTKSVNLTVITDECDVVDTISFDVADLGFAVNAIVSDVTCIGNNDGSVQLETVNGIAPFSYNWSNGIIGSSLDNLVAGDYSYTVVDANNCEVTNTVAVPEPLEPLTIDFEATKTSCAGNLEGSLISVVSGGTAPYAYQWSNQELTNSIQQLDVGEYQLTVTDANGCTLAATGRVGELCRPTIYNVVTPNGDNINDFWEVEDIEDFPNNEVHIYNRWGVLVYNKVGYNNEWNGVDNNGNPILSGAYYYVFRLNDADDIVITGSITLVR